MLFRQTVDSDFKVIPGVITGVLEAVNKEFPLSEQEIFDLKLVLEEAVTNAIKHGNKSAPDLKVVVEAALENKRLSITVRNSGPGFDHRKVPDPTQEDKLMKTSGRGIYLIKKIMDNVDFRDNGREIHMVKIFKTKG